MEVQSGLDASEPQSQFAWQKDAADLLVVELESPDSGLVGFGTMCSRPGERRGEAGDGVSLGWTSSSLLFMRWCDHGKLYWLSNRTSVLCQIIVLFFVLSFVDGANLISEDNLLACENSGTMSSVALKSWGIHTVIKNCVWHFNKYEWFTFSCIMGNLVFFGEFNLVYGLKFKIF